MLPWWTAVLGWLQVTGAWILLVMGGMALCDGVRALLRSMPRLRVLLRP